MTQNPATARTHGDPLPASNRHLTPWYAIECLNSYAATLFTTGAYDYADAQLHVTPATRLWLSAAWGFAYIFISLQSGRLSERFGPRRVVGTMVLLCVLTSLVPLFTLKIPNVWLLLLLMLPFNLTSSTIWPAIEAAITRTRRTDAPQHPHRHVQHLLGLRRLRLLLHLRLAVEKWWWGQRLPRPRPL